MENGGACWRRSDHGEVLLLSIVAHAEKGREREGEEGGEREKGKRHGKQLPTAVAASGDHAPGQFLDP